MKFLKEIIKDKLLLANFISTLLYSVSFPVVNYNLISSVGNKFISANQIFMCIAGIIIPAIWNKESEKMYKHLGKFLIAEVILYICLCLCVVMGIIDQKLYYILDTLFFCTVSKNIISGLNKLRSIRYKTSEKRESYDNNVLLVSNSSCLIGFGISLIFDIPLKIAFIIIFIGITIDNFFQYYIYKNQSSF